ncbi:hypothetical protein [Bradyrhizobium sp. SZCCHNS2015]|uniref:hypothetical protein n=1 Tax=Bradyrhizobium sp. SZCCHNS2015 TaxID=3057305 RepID=UPI0028E787FF|nr:hypothetical protein [Bradyrhizobium sp. SZCCHNS2015]
MMNAVTDENLLAELEDLIRTQPAQSTLNQNTPENRQWIARAIATIGAWDTTAGAQARECGRFLRMQGDRKYYEEGIRLLDLLCEAHAAIRLRTIGPVNTAVGHGLVFDYFDTIRKIVETASTDVLFVDPYLDADFVSRYLPHVRAGVTIRLLARERTATLLPAVTLFTQQSLASLEVRTASGFHDRYLIIDGSSCYQSGASFKDGARNSPTTVTQVGDAFAAVRDTYEDLWNAAKRVF